VCVDCWLVRSCRCECESCWLAFHCQQCLAWVDSIHDFIAEEFEDGAEDHTQG
jgi:hypothetical protein